MNKQPQTTTIASITADFDATDWQQVEAGKRYYHLVTALRQQRLQTGFTQQQLAEKAGLPRETVVMVESGKRNATLETLMVLARAMGKELVIGFK